MAGPADCVTIITGMTSTAESTRKLAAFHLQSLVADTSFADAFVQADGLPVLRAAVLEENGNALAYALGSFTGLLEAGLGWEAVSSDVIERAVQLVVSRPSINVLRNALFLLVLAMSRPIDQLRSFHSTTPESITASIGLEAVMPLLQMHESFLECLVDKLGSADHALCANALNLINALTRDSIVNGAEDEWPPLVIKLQALGVISAVESLMRGGSKGQLVRPLLEFQGLTKVLLARWRHVRIDFEKPEHRIALSQLHASSFRLNHTRPGTSRSNKSQQTEPVIDHASDNWKRLGFRSENPVQDFEGAGFLGLMDLSEFVRRNAESFKDILLGQSVMLQEHRCPIARASLSVTMLLYEYFDVESIKNEYIGSRLLSEIQEDQLERHIEPLILRWETLHCASVRAFLKLWKEAGATTRDYHKIEDLTRLLIGKVLGHFRQVNTMEQIEKELINIGLEDVRKWQLIELGEAYEYAWGADLGKLRESVHDDSVQFLKEQRVRCLLRGAWFPVISTPAGLSDTEHVISAWRFVRLSQDRTFLHHATYPERIDRDLQTHELRQVIDLNTVSSVDSSVSRASFLGGSHPADGLTNSYNSTPSSTLTSLTIYGSSTSSLTANGEERIMLKLHTDNALLASEWLDGLLMLLNQQPITADTNKLIDVLEAWTLKVRMFNLRWEDVDWQQAETGTPKDLPPRPIDRDYWYEMGD